MAAAPESSSLPVQRVCFLTRDAHTDKLIRLTLHMISHLLSRPHTLVGTTGIRAMGSHRSFVMCLLAVAGLGFTPSVLLAQASVNFSTQRVFVTSITPVIGPGGGVGGVDVDADGVLNRALANQALGAARQRAIVGDGPRRDDAAIASPSAMRKVSLRRLEETIAGHARRGDSLTEDLLFLAGLQRIEYVFVYPDSRDVVIAGPAEGWIMDRGEAVGKSNGEAVLRLDDLVDALQSAEAASQGNGISCSIDPSEEGMARVQQLFRRRNLRISESVLAEMQELLGDQSVTITGIRPSSHFARVLVGSDFLMKRFAMDLEAPPVAGLSSYMEMLARSGAISRVSAPRWWMAPDYSTVEKSEDELAWKIEGRGVRALSEHGYLTSQGRLVETGRPSPLAKAWADRFTAHYEALCEEVPVLSQLRGCIDLAVLAAVLMRHDLLTRAECPLLMLTDARKITGESMSVPKRIASQARALRGARGWVVSVSGGVDLDTAGVLAQAEVNPKLEAARDQAKDVTAAWWWD